MQNEWSHFLQSMDKLANAIISPLGISVAITIILFFAIVASIFFLLRLRPILNELKTAFNLILRIDGEEGFAVSLPEFDSAIRNLKILKHTWHEFHETLLQDPDAMPPVIFNTQPAAAFFTRDAVISKRVDLRFYNAVPNLLTGAGILGTFIGLVCGIYLASNELADNDPVKATAALQSLLHGASLAFLTSIAGLVSSILFSWLEKYALHRVEGLRHGWIAALDERLQRLTPERIARDTQAHTRQQTTVLKQFTDQLAFQVARAFEEAVSKPMGPVLERLIVAVEGLRTDQGRSNAELILKVVGEFKDAISGAAGKEMAAFAGAIKDVADQLKEQVDAMNAQSAVSQQRFRAEVEATVAGTADRLSRAAEEMSGILRNATEETARHLREVSARFEESISRVGTALEHISQITSDTQNVMEGAQLVVESVRSAGAELAGTATPIREASAEFHMSANVTKKSSEEIGASVRQVEQIASDLRALQEGVSGVWDQYQKRFTHVDESLARVFEKLEAGLSDYTTQVEEFAYSLDGHTSTIVKDLSGATNELHEVVEDLLEALKKSPIK